MRRALAWVLIVTCLVGWPGSIMWWARSEPVFVLSLSWLALILTAVDMLFTAQVKESKDAPK